MCGTFVNRAIGGASIVGADIPLGRMHGLVGRGGGRGTGPIAFAGSHMSVQVGCARETLLVTFRAEMRL